MTGGSVGERQRALSQALAGRDPALRATALRYAVCAKNSLVISSSTNAPDLHTYRFIRMLFGTVSVPIGGCEPRSGTFDISGVNVGYKYNRPVTTPAGGQISGARVSMRFTNGSFGAEVECSGDFKLQDAETLAGQLSCAWGRHMWTSPATIPIF